MHTPTPFQIDVVDLSHHNKVSASTDWTGIKGIIHKASEGESIGDPKYDARRFISKNQGLLWGAYHFLRPGNMANQASMFLARAEPDKDTLMACDYEDPKVSLADLKAFLMALGLSLGRMPVLYCGHVLKEKLVTLQKRPQADLFLAKHRLWLAQYGQTAKLPAGWLGKPWLWQYSDGVYGPEPHAVQGITPHVDCNMAGDPAKLAAEWAG